MYGVSKKRVVLYRKISRKERLIFLHLRLDFFKKIKFEYLLNIFELYSIFWVNNKNYFIK